jgi:DNA-binding NarL/FixJ family response regulator
VMILDLHLPDGNGADLIRDLKAVNPQATAVVLTTSVDPAEARQAVERGAAAVLNKLVELDAVFVTVKRLRRQPPDDGDHCAAPKKPRPPLSPPLADTDSSRRTDNAR